MYRLQGEDVNRVETGELVDGVLRFGHVNIHTWLDMDFGHMEVPDKSTTAADYRDSVDAIVDRLGRQGGKTVICRNICGRFNRFEPLEMLEEYFSCFPTMFRFLFFHPDTGYWMGATPELLLEKESDRTAYTRALAGTRKSAGDMPWDEKNIEEHRFVTDDICRRIMGIGKGYKTTPMSQQSLPYGKIEHLCTPIKIESATNLNPADIVEAIHPTPAVCGYPREKALADIEAYEVVPRNYYGGYIDAGNLLYVVLRCVHFDEKRWCIYTGSGITAQSKSDDEWAETEAKAEPLVRLLSNY